MSAPISWIIATVFSLLLASGAGYVIYLYATKPPPFHPVYCDPQYQDQAVATSSSSRAPARIKNNSGSGNDSDYQPAVGPLNQSQNAVSNGVSAAVDQIGNANANPNVDEQYWQRKPPPAGKNPNFDRFVTYNMADADGSPIAREIGDNFGLDIDDQGLAQWWFIYKSERAGALGFMRTALAWLDLSAFQIAKDSPKNARLYVPFCPYANFAPYEAWENAYIDFKYIEKCQTPGQPQKLWLDAMEAESPLSRRDREDLDHRAEARFRGGIETIRKRKYGSDPLGAGLVKARQDFCHGTPAGQEEPGGFDVSYGCGDAKTALQALNYGRAFYAKGNQEQQARACYNTAIELAKDDPSGPEAGFQAQRALQNLASSCKWNHDSLAAIGRDYNARSVDLIRVETLQQALRALSHYDGSIDGQLSPATRAAVRKFQREQGDDETDMLTPLQITQLICSAAETEDLASQTALGVMYILGDGVVRNIDSAQQWLIRAANRHYPDASYNLAMLYGTGFVLDSYRLCDVPRAPEQADRYLAEAADARNYSVAPNRPPCRGQLMAQKLLGVFGPGSKYGALPPSDRWLLIERQALDKIRSGPFANRFPQNIGKQCQQPLKIEP